MSADNQIKNYRVGEVSYTKYGTKATIIEYVNNKKVLIEFNDDYHFQYYTSYANFINGRIINPYDKNIYGVGFIGTGRYNSKNKSYFVWTNMLRRCYVENKSHDILSYKGCTVCDEWHNYQSFAKWYEQNKYDCPEPLVIDKDIKNMNNKIYSPENCLLVPNRINLLFVNNNHYKSTAPIGSTSDKRNGMYRIVLNKKYVGSAKSESDAFLLYKKAKENLIKNIANRYKDIIPNSIYEVLLNYKVKER